MDRGAGEKRSSSLSRLLGVVDVFDGPLCPACKIEHDLAWEVQPSGWTGGLEPKEWWGPTRHDIDEEDLEFGFYATSATEGDMPLALDEYRD